MLKFISMKNIFLLISLFLFSASSFAQQLLNGDFENSTASADLINLDNSSFNSYMSDCYAFGYYGNIDIITSTTYCSIGCESGDWYIALTGSGTDAMSMKINQPLTEGYSYSISFNDRWCNFGGYINHKFVFGLSEAQDDFGEEIYTASLPTENEWTEKEFIFTAPNNGQYLTIKVDSGDASSTWELIDNVKFAGKSTGISLIDKNTFDVYPNPAKDRITITGATFCHEIKIYNTIGQLIFSRENADGSELMTFDLSSFVNGIYTCEFIDSKNQVLARKKIIKQD